MAHEMSVQIGGQPTNIAKRDEIVGLLKKKYDEN